jgi:hypothetical protein
MRARLNFLLLAQLCALLFVSGANAFERSDGTVVECAVDRDGKHHIVKENWLGDGAAGDHHPALGGAAAVIRPDSAGWPEMFFDRVVFKGMIERDPHMADFIFYHECGHAQDEQLDEIGANCYALNEMQKLGLMNDAKLAALAATHHRMLRLASRYGGSGKVFWERTMACFEKTVSND